MANTSSQDDDFVTSANTNANTWSLTSTSTPNISGFSGSAIVSGIGAFGIYVDEYTNVKEFCRKCGKDYGHTAVFLIPGFCKKCVSAILVEVFKNTMPKTTEYCQDCFSHFKACKCEKKQALDKIKS